MKNIPHILKISYYQSKDLASALGSAVNMVNDLEELALNPKENMTDVQYCHD